MKIQPLSSEHWPAVKAIYEEGLATGNASFQTSAPSWEDWDKSHRHIAVLSRSKVRQWRDGAALTPVSGRCVYAGVAEVSVYVAWDQRGKGIGKTLLEALVTASEANGIWTLQAGIFPENTASIRLHEGAGFRQVGKREKIGKMGDRWRDTILLEKRSETIGL
ncbi:N-acetyltransferase family protein [Puia sp. P3]|uniref:GNAT family N-acetyltransferase n=1 Tax=Puia sp. P3 TaxID=3423952 RepID=UPI003D666AFC